jgi:hypothetical protein
MSRTADFSTPIRASFPFQAQNLLSGYATHQELERLFSTILNWRSRTRFSTIPLWLSLFSSEASMLAGIGRFAQAYSQEN